MRHAAAVVALTVVKSLKTTWNHSSSLTCLLVLKSNWYELASPAVVDPSVTVAGVISATTIVYSDDSTGSVSALVYSVNL